MLYQVKMNLKSSRNFIVAAHICGWLIMFLLPMIFAPGAGWSQLITNPNAVYIFLIKNILWMSVFYLNFFYVAPIVLVQKNVGRYLILIVLIILTIGFSVSWVDNYVTQKQPPNKIIHHTPPQNQPPPPDRPMPREPRGMPPPNTPPFISGVFFSNLLITVIVVVISTFIVLWNNWQASKKAEQEQTLQKVAAELSVLKLQISPHFLFNTLNNIRWLIRSESKMAEAAVLKLSQILRYVLYQVNTEYVLLEKELELIYDFISLQKMRLTDTEKILFEVKGEPKDKTIVPLLFLPIVENFFKYADFESDFVNKIKIELTEDELRFSVVNKILKSANQKTGGIGMENLKKRLMLHYPYKHDIQIINAMNGLYSLDMTIKLK